MIEQQKITYLFQYMYNNKWYIYETDYDLEKGKIKAKKISDRYTDGRSLRIVKETYTQKVIEQEIH